MILIFRGTSTYSNIGHNIRQIWQIIWIQHFVCCREACFLQHLHMKMTNSNNALQQIWLFLWIWLMHHPHIALASGSRLISVDTRNDNQLVLGFFLYVYQAGNIVQNSFLIVS